MKRSAPMKRPMRFVVQITRKNPSTICIFITLVTLLVDFTTGRDIRFPLLYLIPIGLASWMERKIQVAGVRHAIRQITIDRAEALAKEALSATTPKEIQEIVSSVLYKTAA